MSLTADQVSTMCRVVGTFSHLAGWRWQAMPVIAWEFATISDFMGAKRDVLTAVLR